MRNDIHHTNQKTPIPIKVSVKDNYGNVVASGNYTTAGTYSLSFTPASTSATYSLEFNMTKASAFCFFRVDDVLVSYDDTTTVTVCKEVEDGYRYGYQGSEKDNEVKGKGNSYTTFFRQLDPRLGRWLSIDPKTSSIPWQSPYCSMNNNPIIFNDILGDSIGLDKSFTDNGTKMKAMEEMVNTNEGKSFLADYAKKGQTIAGVTFNEDGKYHEKNIDLIFINDEIKGKSGGGKTFSETKEIGENGVLKTVGMTVKVYLHKGKGWQTDNWGFNSIVSIFHECFIHVALDTEDFLDDNFLNSSNMTSADKQRAGGLENHYHHKHVRNGYEKNNGTKNVLWPNQAFEALKSISAKWKLAYSDKVIWKAMWNSSGL